MRDLRELLAKYSATPPMQGGRPKKLAWTTNELQTDLQAVSDKNRAYFLICVCMAVVLFVSGCVVALTRFTHPNQVVGTFGVVGFSLTAVFSQMMRLWKEKVYADALLVLAGSLNPEQIKQILEIILRKMTP